MILPFEENKEKLGANKKSRGFNDGMLEIQNEPNIVSLKGGVLNDQVNLKLIILNEKYFF